MRMRSCTVVLGFFLVVAFAGGSTAEAAKRASVKIVNKSQWAIHHLYLSPTDETEWGPDQLRDATVDSGEAFTLTDIACSDYDVKLVDEDGDECVIEDVDLCGGKEVWQVTSAALLACQGFGEAAAAPKGGSTRHATVKIVNTSHFQLDHFFLSPSRSNEWGPDQLGEDVIESGGSFTLTDIACNVYDVKIVDEDDDVCVVAGVDLCRDNSMWQVTNKDLLSCQGYGD